MKLFKNSKILEIESSDEYDADLSSNPTFYNMIKKVDLTKWYYTNKKIYYKHNEYGYRSDNLSDIKDSDYILTFGCSYSYGTGLFYEDTYSYKLSKELGLKNINLAIPGSGIKNQQYNTTLFVNNFIQERLPKYVLYQYPNDYRVTLTKHKEDNEEIEIFTNQMINKINHALEKFRYNVIIAIFHEIYSFFRKISEKNTNYNKLYN